MRRMLTAGCTVVAAMSALTLAASAQAGPPSDVIDVAHRGSSGSAPENTVAAVEYAVDQRSSFVEVDVQRSADGELVVVHDTTLERTTDVEEVFPDRDPWNVGDFTLEELRQLDAGSWFSSDFAGEPIPTLREVVDALGPRTGFLLEVKSPELYPGIEADIHEELSSIPGYMPRSLRTGRLVVQSFDIDSMRTYHDVAPEVPIGLLYGTRPTEEQLVDASTWAEQVNTNYQVADQELIDRIHELGMTISVYTIDSGQVMREYINLGVDGIITNYPGVLRDILQSKR